MLFKENCKEVDAKVVDIYQKLIDLGIALNYDANEVGIYETSGIIIHLKSKVVLEKDDHKVINYGKGCYCGAMGLSEEVITASKERNTNQ